MEKIEIKHFKVLQLPVSAEPNSIYYVLDLERNKVKTYITDNIGIPIPLIDLKGESIIESVTGTAVTGTITNPEVNIVNLVSSEIGNLVKISLQDGKIKVNKITSPDLSLEVVNTTNELQLQLASELIEKINNALQPEDISQYTNEDAQDAVGNILADTNTIDLIYSDVTPEISASVKQNSITSNELSNSVNNSLNLANTAVQPVAIQNFFNKLTDDTDDIVEGTVKKFVTDTEKTFWNLKQDALISGINIKNINGSSLLGLGNLEVKDYIEVDSYSVLISTIGISEKVYLTRDDNKLYRFNGTIYVPLNGGVSQTETIYFNPKTTKIAFIGDSITYGVGSSTGDVSYADILNSFFGFQTYTKLGFSSMTVKPSSPRPQLSDKIALIPAGTNFITLMIGINDWAENNVIGDVNAVNAKTYASLNQNLSFAEAFRYNLETIKRNFPNAQIRVITPIKHDDTWNRDLDFKFYVEAEMQIANFLSIPIINAYDGSEIYQSSTSNYIPDGIHPNDAGYNMIAEFVKKGIIDNKTEHQSNTQYNSLVVGKQELRSNTTGETLRLTGKGFNGGDDSVGGVSLGLFFNDSGNRYSYLGGSDSQKKLIFYDNSINVYDFTNGVYSNLDLGSFGKRVNVGNSLGSGDIMNISNYTYPASNILLGLFGGIGQSGDYIKIQDASSNTLLRFKSGGDLEVTGKATVSNPPTNANDVVRKTELDLKANDSNVVHLTGNETKIGTLSLITPNIVSGVSNLNALKPIVITGGNGGDNNKTTGSAQGGTSGSIIIKTGNGGNSLTSTGGTNVGGNAGEIYLVAGDGGQAVGGATNIGGNAGVATLQGGDSYGGVAGHAYLKGGNNRAINGLGANVYIAPGYGDNKQADENADLSPYNGTIFLNRVETGKIRGNTVIGGDTDNKTDRLQVYGTISSNPATLSNQVVIKSQLDTKISGNGRLDYIPKFDTSNNLVESIYSSSSYYARIFGNFESYKKGIFEAGFQIYSTESSGINYMRIYGDSNTTQANTFVLGQEGILGNNKGFIQAPSIRILNSIGDTALFDTNGDVLIGSSTNNTQGKLQVNGNITANPATLSNQVVVKSQTLYTTPPILTINKIITTADFINNNELILSVDASGGDKTIELLPFTNLIGYKVTVKKIDSSSNSVLIQGVGGVNIDGQPNLTVSGQYGKVTIGANLSQYIIL